MGQGLPFQILSKYLPLRDPDLVAALMVIFSLHEFRIQFFILQSLTEKETVRTFSVADSPWKTLLRNWAVRVRSYFIDTFVFDL